MEDIFLQLADSLSEQLGNGPVQSVHSAPMRFDEQGYSRCKTPAPALHIFRRKIEQLYLQICGFIREDCYADPYGTKKRTFSLRLFRFAGHFSNRMVYHAGYSDVRKDPMQIIWGLLIKIRACFLQMKRIGNISQRKFLWTILKRNARRTILLLSLLLSDKPTVIPAAVKNIFYIDGIILDLIKDKIPLFNKHPVIFIRRDIGFLEEREALRHLT